jgi:diguanylate cyclase (GGDEF)-like protein/PAS domain S-box-containing protein
MAADEAIVDVLGWRPDELVGHASTDLIHPQDQPGAVELWFAMLKAPGEERCWRGRYHAADGSWVWIETVNANLLDDPEHPRVVTRMTRIPADEARLEEDLRARSELLTRLADALPIGVFQIDAERRVTFANDRLLAILDTAAAATLDAQLARVVGADLAQLEAVVAGALAGEDTADAELRIRTNGDGAPNAGSERVCVLAMRPVVDGAGAVTGAIGCLSDITDRVLLRRELELRASTDRLTGCLNRSTILDAVAVGLAQPTRTEPMAVIYVDLDRFKAINDGLGHAAGDEILRITGQKLRAAVRGRDRIGRLGGDEFLVLCPGIDTPAAALHIGHRLARDLDGDVTYTTGRVRLTASVGVAWTDRRLPVDALVAEADGAMYVAKRGGGARAVLAEDRQRRAG